MWRSVLERYELSPSELALLAQAARVADLVERLDVALLDESLTVTGSTGQPKAHPLLAASAEQRRLLETLLNALSLPMPNEIEGRRRSPSATAAAQARWRERRSS